MNAGERRKHRRFRSLVNAGRAAGSDRIRADNAEIQVALLKDRAAELESRLAALTNARDELYHENQNLVDLAAQKVIDLREVQRRKQELADEHIALVKRFAGATREIGMLRDEDHDSAKLRRRLRDAHAELASAHARVRALEAAARPARVDGAEAFAWAPPAAKEPA